VRAALPHAASAIADRRSTVSPLATPTADTTPAGPLPTPLADRTVDGTDWEYLGCGSPSGNSFRKADSSGDMTVERCLRACGSAHFAGVHER
jgi:hypothetical protein